MKTLALLTLLSSVVVVAAQDTSSSLSGSYLLRACQADIRMQDNPRGSSSDLTPALECVNYIQGFMDAGTLSTAFCTENASVSTVVRVYVAYLQKNPKLLDAQRGAGLLLALTSSFPCSKQ